MRYLTGVLIFLFSLCAQADIYQVVDNSGDITYSDTPSKNAQKLNVTPTNVSKTNPPPTTTKQSINDGAIAKKPYTVFKIVSPMDQETIQNQFDIIINLQVEPDLQPGDAIQVYVDGNPTGPAAKTTSISLGQLNRGVHQVYAVLTDSKSSRLKQSNAITIYVHNASAAFPTRTTNNQILTRKNEV